jgi:energy-coupling factor transporter ATP-binding protein EcfA2
MHRTRKGRQIILRKTAGKVRRIAVLGCSGSGKSTLAAALAERLSLPYVATDAVFWTADWRPTPAAQVRAWLDQATAAESWVTDGNFDGDRDLLWARADVLVWIDLPLSRVLAQGLARNLGWWLSGAKVWNGQRMTLAKAIDGARHQLRSHGLKRGAYPAWLADCRQATVVKITEPGRVADRVQRVIDAL